MMGLTTMNMELSNRFQAVQYQDAAMLVLLIVMVILNQFQVVLFQLVIMALPITMALLVPLQIVKFLDVTMTGLIMDQLLLKLYRNAL
jgi:hypothetical protein